MVVLFGVDVPNRDLVRTVQKRAGGLEAAEHRVVHVVVAVLSVAADAIEVGKAVQPLPCG